MKYLRYSASLFLTALVFFSWGFAVSRYNIFPFSIINPFITEIKTFIAGHPLEKKTSLFEKMQHDFGGIPKRELTKADFPPNINIQEAQDKTQSIDHTYSRQFVHIDTEKLKQNNVAAVIISTRLLLSANNKPSDYYLIIDENGNIRKVLDCYGIQQFDCLSKSDYKFHSVKKSKDEQITELIQLNSCGKRDWSVKGNFSYHHYVQDGQTPTSVWIWDGLDMVEYAKTDGRELQRISMSDVINQNPFLHIFESRLNMSRWKYGRASFRIADGQRSYTYVTNCDFDPFHPNDIEPLGEQLSKHYPMFDRGDLLLSFRSINLLFVLRPNTKQVLWYSYGQTGRQHDPDWNNRGTITVFDNKFHNDISVISELQPNSNKLTYLIGNDDLFRFYKATGGSHKTTENGNMIFFGSDAFVYGKSPSVPDLSFVFANQFKTSEFFESYIQGILDKQTLDAICN